MRRHHREWQAAAREHGFRLQSHLRNGHLRFLNADNGEVVTCSSTPSDVHALKKFVADMRRANRRHLTEPIVCGDPPPDTTPIRYQPLQAARKGRPAAVSTGEPAMPTVAELTIGSLRQYADTQARQRAVPKAGTLRRAVINVLAASSYLDTDRLLDVDFGELDNMLAAARPDLSPASRSTYIGKVRRIAKMLIAQTAAQHGHNPPALTGRPNAAGAPDASKVAAKKAGSASRRPAAARAQDPGQDTNAEPAVLTFPFPLRPGLTVTLTLPADLTEQEADRLTQMIKLLPLGSR